MQVRATRRTLGFKLGAKVYELNPGIAVEAPVGLLDLEPFKAARSHGELEVFAEPADTETEETAVKTKKAKAKTDD